MSRHHKTKDIIADHAYHGTSTVAMEMSPYKFDSSGWFGQMPWIHKAMNPDMYRGPYKYGDESAGEKYAEDVQRIIESLKVKAKCLLFFCETLLGWAGRFTSAQLSPGSVQVCLRCRRVCILQMKCRLASAVSAINSGASNYRMWYPIL